MGVPMKNLQERAEKQAEFIESLIDKFEYHFGEFHTDDLDTILNLMFDMVEDYAVLDLDRRLNQEA